MTCPWIDIGRQYIGLAEIPGPRTASFIARWLAKLGAAWRDDETPWCGTFVAGVMADSGFQPPTAWARARSWADWGPRIAGPAHGCIVVFERGRGGHVGFVVGEDARGRLAVLGGNQGNGVNVSPFDRSRVIAYVWPPGLPLPDEPLQRVALDGASSTNEA